MPGYCAVCSRIRLLLGPPIQKRAKISPLSRHRFITLLRETFRYLFSSFKRAFVEGSHCAAYFWLPEVIPSIYPRIACLVFIYRGKSSQVVDDWVNIVFCGHLISTRTVSTSIVTSNAVDLCIG